MSRKRRRKVTRPDDGVQSFFGSRTRKVLSTLLDETSLESLRRFFAPGHRESAFNLPTLLWLGVFGAAHAVLPSMKAILEAAVDALAGGERLPLRGKRLSQSGWSRAKMRLSLGLLRCVWWRWVDNARAFAGEDALFYGLHLVALDKKTFTVPEDLWETFGSHQGCRGAGPAQAELLVAYDVCVRVPLLFTLGRACDDEKAMARRLLRRLKGRALLLIDSGFYSMQLFRDAKAAGHEFLTKMKSNGKPVLVKELGPNDGLYEISASPAYWKKTDPTVPRTMQVRIVTYHAKGFRPVRLVTSLLDADAFPREDIIKLYGDRWHVETFFRELQEDVKFEHFHTKKLKGLYVELLFYMIYVSTVRAHMAEAAKEAGVLPGQLSWRAGSTTCVRAWCRLGALPAIVWEDLHRELVEVLGAGEIDVRPGRRFERDRQKRRGTSREKKLAAREARQAEEGKTDAA